MEKIINIDKSERQHYFHYLSLIYYVLSAIISEVPDRKIVAASKPLINLNIVTTSYHILWREKCSSHVRFLCFILSVGSIKGTTHILQLVMPSYVYFATAKHRFSVCTIPMHISCATESRKQVCAIFNTQRWRTPALYHIYLNTCTQIWMNMLFVFLRDCFSKYCWSMWFGLPYLTVYQFRLSILNTYKKRIRILKKYASFCDCSAIYEETNNWF